ncbi:hypothetical protein ASE01_09145 [Nocardioides sp. Root190]|uniref:hypothetical protein n=1 Tax=Nocardioides sp. Root190 TaxID=1736488 RepID=UPI0007005683|nr:hypothetical protein [Nocardioides sp. Root190]KRB76925.1 hypothetical protein ASE01_09145 [Nocardioides sp. Root190]
MTTDHDSEDVMALVECPDWCRTPAAEHAQDDPDEWMHEGPLFGLVQTWLLDGPDPVFTTTIVETPSGELTPDELRQLATDALDAAMWIDRQRRTLPQVHGLSVVELVRQAHAHSSRSA